MVDVLRKKKRMTDALEFARMNLACANLLAKGYEMKNKQLTTKIEELKRADQVKSREIHNLKLEREALMSNLVEEKRKYEEFANLDDETKEIVRMVIRMSRDDQLDAEGFAKFLEGFPDKKVTSLEDVKTMLTKYLKLIYKQNSNSREQAVKIFSLNEQIKRMKETCVAFESKLAEKERELYDQKRECHKIKDDHKLLHDLCDTLNRKLLSYDDTKRREYQKTLKDFNDETYLTISSIYEMVKICAQFIGHNSSIDLSYKLNSYLVPANPDNVTTESIFDDTFLKKHIKVFRLLKEDLFHFKTNLGLLNIRDIDMD